jgi:hypothetical protein
VKVTRCGAGVVPDRAWSCTNYSPTRRLAYAVTSECPLNELEHAIEERAAERGEQSQQSSVGKLPRRDTRKSRAWK